MPKEARVSGGVVSLWRDGKPLAMLITSKDFPRTVIGADEINDRIISLGGTALPVRNSSDLSKEDFNKYHLIVIGGLEENSIAREYCEKYRIQLDAKNPGPQGYIIRYVKRRKKWVILLSGSDSQGSLYACVTFRYLLEKRKGEITANRAAIRDWPDFKYRFDDHQVLHRREGLTPCFLRALYAGNKDGKTAEDYYKEYVDWMLRHKLNVIGHTSYMSATEGTASANRYARERGIETFWMFRGPFEAVGKVAEDKGKPEYEGVRISRRSPQYYVCWSRDDMHRRYLEKHAHHAAKFAYSVMWFHCTDTGASTFNYALWKDRCDECKRRFGNDRAAADANLINIIREVFHRIVPDVKLFFIIYPYSPKGMTKDSRTKVIPGISGAYAKVIREELPAYYRRLVKLVPTDIGFVVREGMRENMECWRSYFGSHPTFTYLETGDSYSPLFFTTSRYTKTFHFKDDRDIIYLDHPTLRGQLLDNPVRQLLGAEFSWNTEAPGAAYYPSGGYRQGYLRDGIEPEVILKDFVPLACRNIWGGEAAPYMIPLFTSNINPTLIERPDRLVSRFKRLRTAAGRKEDAERTGVVSRANTDVLDMESYVRDSMNQQYEAVRNASDNLKLLLESGYPMTLYSHRYAVSYYKYCRLWSLYADIWRTYFQAEEAAKSGHVGKVDELIKRGKKLANELPQEIEAILRETAGQPQFYPFFPAVKESWGTKNWLVKPEEFIDKFISLEARKELIRKAAKAGPAPEECLSPRTFKAIKVPQPPVIDGKLNDPCWGKVQKYGKFICLLEGGKPTMAIEQTEVQFAYDDEMVYIAATLHTPGGKFYAKAKGHDKVWTREPDDIFQVFLDTNLDRKTYYHFSINPIGTVQDGFLKDSSWEGEWERAATMGKECWFVEIGFPLPEGEKSQGVGDKYLPSETWNAGRAEHKSTVRERFSRTGELFQACVWKMTGSEDAHFGYNPQPGSNDHLKHWGIMLRYTQL